MKCLDDDKAIPWTALAAHTVKNDYLINGWSLEVEYILFAKRTTNKFERENHRFFGKDCVYGFKENSILFNYKFKAGNIK